MSAALNRLDTQLFKFAAVETPRPDVAEAQFKSPAPTQMNAGERLGLEALSY
jgi:hypothetical protein